MVENVNDSESRPLHSLKREADEDDDSTADLVPRMPAVVPLLLRGLRDGSVSHRQLADQVVQDPVLPITSARSACWCGSGRWAKSRRKPVWKARKHWLATARFCGQKRRTEELESGRRQGSPTDPDRP